MLAVVTQASGSPSPLRAPFGWPTVELSPPSGQAGGGGVLLRWPDAGEGDDPGRGGWLRISVAVDDREEKIVTANLAETGTMIGQFDLRHSHSLEPWQIQLNARTFSAAIRQGIRLSLTRGVTPLWIIAEGEELPGDAKALAPHLLADAGGSEDAAEAARAFSRMLRSRASVQTFGWMEGCVLDGLYDLGELAAVDRHLALFITADHRLVYENPRGQPSDGRIYGIEGTLPFAVLAKRHPDHPLLDMLLAFYAGHLNPDGSFRVPESYTAEGSYTIAYPLAVIAAQRGDRKLATLAASVLRQRRERLRRSDGLWLRHHENDTRTFRSWARGVAWYLLGLARTLEFLPPGNNDLAETSDLGEELSEAIAWALGYQRESGLWGCYLDDAGALDDTSGSAGIAAALALAARLGLADEGAADAWRAAAGRCWQGLMAHLTPDGFLDGAAQSNRGGEALQRAPYRVLSPMGMGLMGQLAAGLGLGGGEG